MSKIFTVRPVTPCDFILIQQQTATNKGLKTKTDSNKEKNEEGKNPALLIFDDDLFAELFNARCHDTGEPVNSNIIKFYIKKIVEKAKIFKDELMRLNQKKNGTLNLHSLRLGVNSIISLSSTLQNKDVRI